MSEGFPVADLSAWSFGSLRVLALFIAAPVFGHRSVPVRLRIGLAMLVGAALAGGGVGPDVPAMPSGASALTTAVIGELFFGLSVGFAVRILFSAFSLAGEFASIQGGLGAARVLDPTTGQSSVALASLFDLVMILVYLGIDGHHMLIRALSESYAAVPLGLVSVSPEAGMRVVAMAGSIFEIAVQLAAPITTAMLVSNVALGILARVAPQLNLMTVQLPAHMAMTLSIVSIGAGSLLRVGAARMETWHRDALSAVMGGP